MSEIEISIDRKAKKWALFDGGFNCVHGFMPFTDEAQALADAKAEAARRGTTDPKVVYPRIDSMRVTYSRKKAKQ